MIELLQQATLMLDVKQGNGERQSQTAVYVHKTQKGAEHTFILGMKTTHKRQMICTKSHHKAWKSSSYKHARTCTRHTRTKTKPMR